MVKNVDGVWQYDHEVKSVVYKYWEKKGKAYCWTCRKKFDYREGVNTVRDKYGMKIICPGEDRE